MRKAIFGVVVFTFGVLGSEASAAAISIEGAALTLPVNRLTYTVAGLRTLRGDVTTDVPDGTWTIRAFIHGDYGTFTVSGGVITATTGALIASGQTLSFDLSALARVTLFDRPLSQPAGRETVSLSGLGNSHGQDTTFYLPDGASYNPVTGSVYSFGNFDIVNGLVTNTTGALVPVPGGVGFDLTKLARVTLFDAPLSVPAGREHASLSGVGRSFGQNTVFHLPDGQFVPVTGSVNKFGRFDVVNGIVTNTTGAVVAVPDGVGFDLTKLARVTLFDAPLSDPPGLVSASFSGVGRSHGEDTVFHLPDGPYHPNVFVFPLGTFEVVNRALTNLTGSVVAVPGGVAFDPCQLNQVRFDQVAGPGFSISGVGQGVDGAVYTLPSATYSVFVAGALHPFTVNANGLSATALPENDPHLLLSLEFCVTNTPPQAAAGPDQSVTCADLVTLDGTGSSDPDGDPLTYTWSGPQAATGAQLTVGPLPVGVYEFTLTVDDGQGGTDSDTVVVTVSPCACPKGQGYWKNHPEAWPVTQVTLGGLTYTQAELLTIFQTPPRGDARLILAHQLIATKLNLANGSDPAPLGTTVADADLLLSSSPPLTPVASPKGKGKKQSSDRVPPSSPAGQEMVRLAEILDAYNNSVCEHAPAPSSPVSSTESPSASVAAPVADSSPSPPNAEKVTSSSPSAAAPGGGSGGGCSIVSGEASGLGSIAWLLLFLGLLRLRTSPR